MNTSIKLIACDLDGTLLLNGAQELNPEIFDLILALKEKGILFVAASGRQYANQRRLFAPVQNEIAYICENGALCYYHDELLYESVIDRETGLSILKSIRQQEDCEILLSGADRSYLESKDKSYIHHMTHVVKNNVELVDSILDVQAPFLKISACNFNGIHLSQEYFEKKYGDIVTVATSGYIWLDMVAKGTNKSTALSQLIRRLFISPSQCAAFGDNYNDIQMLEFVQDSYAVKTAQPGVADHCRYISDNVCDSIRTYL